MKSCPVCKSTYEDWIDFCFNDGIPLVAVQTPAPAAVAPPEDEEEPDARYSAFDAFDAPEPTMIRLAREASGHTSPGVDPPVAPPAPEPPAPVVEEEVVEVPVPPPVAPVARTFAPPPEPPPRAPDLPRTIVPDSPPPAPQLPPSPPVAPVAAAEEPRAAAPAPRSALDDDEGAVSAVAKGAGAGLIIAGVLGVGALIAILAGGAWWLSTRGGAPPPPPEPTMTAPVEPATPVTPPPAPVEPTPDPVADATPPVEPPPPLPPEPTKPEEVKPEPVKPEPVKPEVKPVVPPTTPTTPTTPATSPDAVWATPVAATKGVLLVTSDPVGAQVYVDGAARGAAPVRLELPYGAHSVRATLSGYTAQAREINLNVEQMSVPLKLSSEISSGSINLFGPTGGHVWLDNHDLGTLPVTVVVAEGVRNIRLTQADGKTCSFAKEVRFTTPGKPVTVRLDGCP